MNPADTGFALLIGGEPTSFLLSGSKIRALIPLFLDSATVWPDIPSGAQDVVLVKNDDTVAVAFAALTIDSLPHASGATETIRQDLQTIAQAMKQVAAALPPVPGSDPRLPGYWSAVSAMLDSIVMGSDSSIQALINGTSSWSAGAPNVELLDAVMASCGALDYFDEFAASMAGLSQAVAAASEESIFCRSGGEDLDLACQMQIYVVLSDYRDYVVKPTTRAYAETVGLAAGLVAISGYAIPAHAIISALLTVFDFVYGTLAPSLFPAELTEFSLTVDQDTIPVGDFTSTTVRVAAKNLPATIRATEILEVLITTSGLAAAPAQIASNFREVLKNAISWALGLYRQAVEAYNGSHGGELFIDPEADLPDMTWGPVVVTHSDLVELYTFTPEILEEDTTHFEWKGIQHGDGRAQARGRGAGERAKVLLDHTLCLGCLYYGGAFGNDVPATAIRTIVVGRPAVLSVTITGLPAGTGGSVIVTGPNGYSSGTLTTTQTLTGLEPGNYHITAFNVHDGTGHEYQPSPVDTTVALSDDETGNVEIHYAAKYGSLLLTVSGLPDGVDGDVYVRGPDDTLHVRNDSLIQNLVAGTYLVQAYPVAIAGGADTLKPTPASQTVTVVGHETATCAVHYDAPYSIEFQIGQWRTYGVERCMWAHARYESFYSYNYAERDTGTTGDSNGCFLEPVNMACDGSGNLAGGAHSASASIGTGINGSSSAISLDFTSTSKTVATVTLTASASSHYQLRGDTVQYNWYGAGSVALWSHQEAVLAVKNPGSETVRLIVNLEATGTAEGTSGGAGLDFHLAPYSWCPGGNDGYSPLWLFSGGIPADSSGAIGMTKQLAEYTIDPGQVSFLGLDLYMTTGAISNYYFSYAYPPSRLNQSVNVNCVITFELKP